MSELPSAIGRYRIERILGRGAMGVVYRAHDPEIDRAVAVKLVRTDLLDGEHRADYLARFRQEVQAAGRCLHANIVAVYDFGLHEDGPYLVMEYIEGAGLDQMLRGGAGLGMDATVRIVSQLLEALSFAHAAGIVHRDVKPANILLTPAGRVKVMDFGISRMATSHLTQAGSVMGTPSYMSPEQFRGGPVDARSDVFSAGVVLHETLTGRLPFPGRSFEEVMVKLLYSDGPELAPVGPQMTPALRLVIEKALARDPEDRFASAAAMAEALREADAGHSSAPATAPPPPAREPPAVSDRPAHGPDPELLATVERRLAHHIGPMAARLVRMAARETGSIETLCARVATSIDAPKEREQFLKDVLARVLDRPSILPPAPAAPVDAPPGPGAAARPITAEDLERIQLELTHYVGPIARVLVKRAAPAASSLQDLRQRLAQHLEQPAERAAFLARE